ncbi:AfsR/SARP family transcriptional regulator [Streptomyces sp. NPDC006368]|uniref:AfsR/SARP family transcriptional regulator n=1 Tax=Streptomyces sp. NPDC006368 TaxID=3156760 RepID=UPI0033A0FCED
MRYGLLGPLEVYEDDGAAPLPLGGPRQRAVLASLALRANETVSVDYVADAAWEDPPASPGSNIRTYVNGLRRRLGDDAAHPRLLVTRPPGYQLRTRSGEVDVEVFEDLAARAVSAAREGALSSAAHHNGEALALWRGRPLEGLAVGSALQAQAVRLVERRLAVAEQYVQVLLAMGRPAEAVGVLRPLVAQYPLNENLAAHLMRALHRAGRRTEALEVYRQVGRVLTDELGVPPGEELSAARRHILRGSIPAPAPTPRRAARGGGTADTMPVGAPAGSLPPDGTVFGGHRTGAAWPPAARPAVPELPGLPDAAAVSVPSVLSVPMGTALARTTSSMTAPHPARPAEPIAPAALPRGPAQLHGMPADIAEFTGREAERARVRSWVRAVTGAPRTATAPLVQVITGMPGVGKTRLAVRLAHELAREGHFGDIQLFADLRGHTAGHEPLDPGTVLARFLRMLDVPPDRMPCGVEERAALYRDRLHGRPSLILLDDATGPGQVHPLLPGHPSSLALITSRRGGWALDGASTLPLSPFTVEESVALLARVVGDGRVTAEPEAAERIARLCGRLPLAVALAALRLRARPVRRLADFAARLAPEDTRLDRLSVGGRTVATAFDASYRTLPPHRQRVFRLLAGAPGPVLGPGRGAWAKDADEAEDLLEQLLDESMVRQTASGAYQVHELLRVYARNLPPG